ncbi:MAG: SpaA isopeptide-forming pilin-related protein [Parvimonas sp.]|uniref:MSCRAMM family protein n=1 Tax=Parvimonas sp. TaxID=1944660 RepID=UPI002A74898B|nr:SpaA isopeptide-forming pilin-related protein [Parvimonas sp.]MDY3050839.1 SpaA isopeptide-forming pilin-related protein [Parvimonas sp.]
MKLSKKILTLSLVTVIGLGSLVGAKSFTKAENEKKEKMVYTFTTKDKPEEIIGKLKAGKKYIIREKKAKDGYVRSKDVEFTVGKDGKMQEIKIVNDFTKVEISKKGITGEDELPGAKLKVVDSEGKIVDEWISGKEAHRIDKMKPGKYKLIEEIAPDGHVLATEIEFEVKETAEVQKVVMRDDTTKVKISKFGSDSEDKLLEGCDFDIIEVEE